MKQFFIYIICSIVCSALYAQTTHQPNVVIVKFDREFVESELQPEFQSNPLRKSLMPKFKTASVNRLNTKHSVVSYRQVFVTDPRFVERHQEFDLDLFYYVDFSTDEDPKTVAASFMEDYAVVEFAEPNIINRSMSTPNDIQFNKQWGLLNPTVPNNNADINILNAWSRTTGNQRVVVAIIDDCADPTHEDLRNNLWRNYGEIPGNDIDDDGNGYQDDIHGWNFVHSNGNVGPQHPNDQHGTHVAGIVGARSNNGQGMAGVAGGWGNQRGVELMLFRTGQPGTGNVAYGYEAMVYAADNGAAIAQCSWGWYDITVAGQRAVSYFTRYGGGDIMDGGLVIAAAGNYDTNVMFYPAAHPFVLSVGGIDQKGNHWRSNQMIHDPNLDWVVFSGSNYGDWVDICAPADSIMSSIPSGYTQMSGTSMAAPFVSGVAALVLSATMDIPREQKTPQWLRQHLINTARRINTSKPIGPLLDAGRAVATANPTNISNPIPIVPSVTTVFPNPVSDRLTLQNTSPQNTKSYTLYNIIGETLYQKRTPQQEETIDMSVFTNGLYFLQIETDSGSYIEKIIKN